jgi:hypothetical protein
MVMGYSCVDGIDSDDMGDGDGVEMEVQIGMMV